MDTSPMALKKISNAEYHALDYVSKSHLDEVNKSAFHYWDRYINPDRVIPEPTKQMLLGSAMHTMVLEPDIFENEYLVESANAPKRPTAAQRNAKKPSNQTLDVIAYWEKFDKKANGKNLISNDDYQRLTIMRKRILDHPAANTILNMRVLPSNPTNGKTQQLEKFVKVDLTFTLMTVL